MENFNTATAVQDQQVVSALSLSADDGEGDGAEGDDDGADPIRSLPRPGKPVSPDNQARSEASDIDPGRGLRSSKPSPARSDATDLGDDRGLRSSKPSPARSEGTDLGDERRLRPTRLSGQAAPGDAGPSNPRLLA